MPAIDNSLSLVKLKLYRLEIMCHAYQWWVIVSKTVPSRSKTSPLARESISIEGDAASKHEKFRSSDIDTMHCNWMFSSGRSQFEEELEGKDVWERPTPSTWDDPQPMALQHPQHAGPVPSHDVDDSEQEQLCAATSNWIILSVDDRIPQPGKAPEEECKIAEVQVMVCPDE